MEVYRLIKEKYSTSLNASGAANRWNRAGQFVLYTGSSRAITSLESLVHLSGIIPITKYKMLVIELKEIEDSIQEITLSELSKNWQNLSAYHKNQSLGSRWYDKKEKLLLKVPSAVIPQEYNYIINTKHQDFDSKVSIKQVEDYLWDSRLFG